MDRAAVRSRLQRTIALIVSLGALGMLGMAGGASFGGF